jgi:hypothetical protein
MKNRTLKTIGAAEFRSKFVLEEFLTEGRNHTDISKARIASGLRARKIQRHL